MAVGSLTSSEAGSSPNWLLSGDENVVEVYVGYLLRKVDQPFARQPIQTVRGVGYRLYGAGS